MFRAGQINDGKRPPPRSEKESWNKSQMQHSPEKPSDQGLNRLLD